VKHSSRRLQHDPPRVRMKRVRFSILRLAGDACCQLRPRREGRGASRQEESPMVIPIDESVPLPVREGEGDQPKSEVPNNQEQTPTGKKRSSVLLWVCIGLVFGALLATGVVWLVGTIRREIAAQEAEKNFRRVAQALIDHAKENGDIMTPQAIYDRKTGKPLLSWRVAILPQLGEADLYKQIHLDEPWNSPHNRRFWSRMPAAYELPGLPSSGGMTASQVFTGPETPFNGREGRKYPGGFSDGTSNTVLIAEAAVPVNWMRPEDLDMKKVDPDDIWASLGNRTGKGTLFGVADGSTRFLSPTFANWKLKGVITPDASDCFTDDS
jgi:hypothetical protein